MLYEVNHKIKTFQYYCYFYYLSCFTFLLSKTT